MMAKHKHTELGLDRIYSVRSTVKDLNRTKSDMFGEDYPFRGNYRAMKKLVKGMAKESPDAFAGAPGSWFK